MCVHSTGEGEGKGEIVEGKGRGDVEGLAEDYCTASFTHAYIYITKH